jgi:hypothetical protein
MPSPAGVVAHAWRGTLPTARLLRPDPDRVSAPTRQGATGRGLGTTCHPGPQSRHDQLINANLGNWQCWAFKFQSVP